MGSSVMEATGPILHRSRIERFMKLKTKLFLIEFSIAVTVMCFALRPARAFPFDCDGDCYNSNNCGDLFQASVHDAIDGDCQLSQDEWDTGNDCAAACGCYGMGGSQPPYCVD